MVRAMNGSAVVNSSGVRLGTKLLVVPDSTASRSFSAAIRDANGNWTNFAPAQALACANYTTGASHASIGSAADDDMEIEEPGLRFPDAAMGSGQTQIMRTLISAEGTGPAFRDETRRQKWPQQRFSFRVAFDGLSQTEARMFLRFFRATNGGLKPFVFHWDDPVDGKSYRHVVRFKDPDLVAGVFSVDLSEAEFELIGRLAEAEGDVA